MESSCGVVEFVTVVENGFEGMENGCTVYGHALE